ncbi:hypothetical protein U9M48_024035 [Paspalum notatum var. saurae]|uniref:Uncharacterized protein n=1 Tax=Paspalum notatum var. saurae TaxID=547442 RepID=A0AAQ3WW92_PASNO
MAAPSHPYTPPHHRNMKTECSYHKEDDPLLRSSIHALKDAMEVATLLSMVWRPWRAPPDDPQCRGKAAALWDRVRSGITTLMSPMSSLLPSTACLWISLGQLFALRIKVCEQQQEYFLRKASIA